MSDTRRRPSDWLAAHAEDIALFGGATLLAVGVASAFGVPFGLMIAGVLAIGYGLLIIERRP